MQSLTRRSALRCRLAASLVAALCAALFAVTAPAPATALTLPVLPTVVDGAVTTIAVTGGRVFVGGSFTQVRLPNGTLVSQPSLFAYSLSTGAFDTEFRPAINAGQVLEVEPVPGGAGVYIGGTFAGVNGVALPRLAKLWLNGTPDRTFTPAMNSRVNAITTAAGRLFVGGQFTQAGGLARRMLAELDPATGAVVTGFDFSLSGSAAVGGFVETQAVEASPDGTKLLVAHNATHIGGVERIGLAVVQLRGPGRPVDAVSPWFTRLWKDELVALGGVVKVSDAAWGPDSTWVVAANAGGDRPPTNDSVQAFDVDRSGPAGPRWITRQFDSTYAVSVGPDGTVYSGGHFRYTEAPGSLEPYPGDPNTNYGWGEDDGGARVLGDQVVGRVQLSALDPATGSARNWHAVADGKKGVTALLVAGNRLLVGHDGQRVGAQPSGRHGAVPLFGAERNAGAPSSSTTAPLLGAVLPAGPVTLRGVATAPAGVARVVVEVKVGNRWLRPDGTLGAFAQWPATVQEEGATSTAWSLTLDLPNQAEYVAQTKAVDTAGRSEADGLQVPFETVLAELNPAPEVVFTAPLPNELVTASSRLTASGALTDLDGVASARINYYQRLLGVFLQDDGSLGPAYNDFPVTLAAPGAQRTAWTRTATLPDGPWTLTVRATDSAGMTTPSGAGRRVTMSVANARPLVQVTSPVAGQELTSSTLTVRGTATDDTGVERVYVKLEAPRFGFGSTGTGVYGPGARFLQATLAQRGARSTTWTLTVTGLDLGLYRVDAYAQDVLGVVTPTTDRAVVTELNLRPTGARLAAPRTTIDTPDPATFRPGALRIPLSGIAEYVGGVVGVRLAVRQVSSGRYVRADGTLSPTVVFRPAAVDSVGQTASAWSGAVTVPVAGAYRVDALAVGADGNVDWTPTGARVTYLVYPGDADPSFSSWGSPANGATLADGVLSASGRAVDDTGVASVELLVTLDGTTGLRADGTIGAPQWVRAFLTNPGGTGTNWTFTSPRLPAGTWTVTLRATDVVGKTMLTPRVRTVTVAP